MNNILSNSHKRYSYFPSSIPKTDSNEVNKKRSSFYDDYLERSNQNKKETAFSTNRPVLKLPDLKSQETLPISQNQKTSGSAIKKNIESVLSQKYGELDTRHIFDGVDDKDIEDNIETAENTIKTNVDRGVLSKSILPKLPNLRDGLALSYAAANKGNNKAAKRAIEAAYTEQKSVESFDNLLLNESNNQPTIQPTKYSSFYDDYLKSKNSKDSKNLWNNISKVLDLPKANKNPRYVNADVLNMRSAPGTDSKVIGKLTDGTEVNYTGNKTKEIDGHLWAEVTYDGKTGWVAADYLRIAKPQESFSNDSVNSSATPENPDQSVSQNSSIYDASTSAENVQIGNNSNKNNNPAVEIQENKQSLDWTDPNAVRNEFNKEGNHGNMQCADLTKWVIDKHTDLKRPEGGNNGNVFAENIAKSNGLATTHTPCAPAIFSVKEGTYGPGIDPRGVSDSQYGHTGMALSVKDLGNDMYEITYIDTYQGYNKDGYNSNVRTRTFKKDDNVTYVSLEGHLK